MLGDSSHSTSFYTPDFSRLGHSVLYLQSQDEDIYRSHHSPEPSVLHLRPFKIHPCPFPSSLFLPLCVDPVPPRGASTVSIPLVVIYTKALHRSMFFWNP